MATHRKNEVVWTGCPTIRAMIGTYIKALIGIVVAIGFLYLLSLAGAISMAVVILAALALIGAAGGYGYLKRTMTHYTLTRSRALSQEGVLNIRKEQVTLPQITNVIIERTIFERILGIGTVTIETANDHAGSDLQFFGISDPGHVETLLDELRNFVDEPEPQPDRDLDLSFLDD
jgi:uncharacterized membrane protein YdbT with pleckstrin-like domain